MYLTHLKTMLVKALRTTFDSEFPEADFRDINIGIEYPVEAQGYPAIWVDYDDTDTLQRAGVDHQERVELLTLPGTFSERYTRWRFAGQISLTVVALTSLERDRLYDHLIGMLAFGPQDPAMTQFRRYIEDNDFIAANINFDTIQPRPASTAPGTPWNTDELIYEKGIGLDILGEFLLDRVNGTMVPLSAIKVTMIEDLFGDLVAIPEPGADLGATGWH